MEFILEPQEQSGLRYGRRHTPPGAELVGAFGPTVIPDDASLPLLQALEG